MRQRLREIVPYAACVVLLVITPAALLVPLFQSQSYPLDLRAALFDPPWQEARPAGLSPAAAPMTAAHSASYYPWYRFMHEAASTGESLLWYPLEGFGTPFLAAWRTRVLSPFSLPVYLMSLDAGLRWSMLLKLFIAGCCAFYAGRRFQLGLCLSLFLAVSWQLSGAVFLHLQHPLSDSALWFPLLVVCLDRLVLGEMRAWPLGALVLGLIALGGDPGALVAALLFLGVFVAARCIRDWRGFYLQRAGVGIGTALSLGLLLASVQILPYIEYLREAAPAAAPVERLQGGDLIAVLAPGLLAPGRAEAASGVRLLHVGLVPLLLMGLWWSVRPYLPKAARRRGETLLISVFLMGLLPFLPRGLLSHVPMFGEMGPAQAFFPAAFVFALLAAIAAQTWILLTAEAAKATFTRILTRLPLFWGALLAAAMIMLINRGVPGGTILSGLGAMLVTALVLGLILLVTLLRPNTLLLGVVLAFAAAGSSLWVFGPGIPATDKALAFPETTFTTSLAKADARVAGSTALRHWPLAGNGVSQVFAPSGIRLRRYAAFVERYLEAPMLARRTGAQGLLLTREDIQGDFASVRPDLRIEQVYPTGAILFRDLGTTPRARVIYAGRRVASFEPSLLDPALPPLLEGPALPEKDEGPKARAQVEANEHHDRIAVKIEDTRLGVLVLADAYYPGWTATVDGVSTPIYPVDGVFRGVELTPGEHEVIFAYHPASFRIGTALSALALITILIGFAFIVLRRPERGHDL